MNAALSLDLIESARAGELRADAALRGETIAQAGIRRARDVLEAQAAKRGARGIGATHWARMSPELRQVLVTMATDRRDFEAAALLPWPQLTPAERIAIGSTARQFRRELDGAGWLR